MAASNLYIFYKTPLAETECFHNPYFIYWLPKHLYKYLIHPNTVSQATYGYLPLSLQHLCDLQDTMPRHWLPGVSHPNPILGKWRTSLVVAIILSVCLCSHSQLDCNQFVIHLKFEFIHVNIVKVLLVVKNLMKNIIIFFFSFLSLNPLDRIKLSIRSATTLFSSHKSIMQQPH